MAGQEIGSLFYDLTIDDKNLQAQLDKADKNVQQLGNNATDSFDKFQKGAKVAAVGLGVVGVGLTLYAKNALDFTKDLVKSSKSLGVQIGVSTSEASRLVAAFGRMGIQADSASQMFGIFSKQIVAATSNSETNRLAQEKLALDVSKTRMAIKDATDEIKKHGDKTGELHLKINELTNTLNSEQEALKQSATAFDKLGISTKDSSGKQKGFNSLLFEVADKFKAMPNGIDKTTIALELFGRSGKDMIKVLNLGSGGIQELEKQADRLGLTLNANTISAIAKLISRQKDLKEQTDAMKIAVATATAPVLTEFTSKLNSVMMTLLNTKGPLHDVTVGVLSFGGPIAGAASSILAFTANLDQSKGALLALGSGMSGLIGLLRTPWVLAFIAAGVAVAAVTAHLFAQQSQSERLKAAHDNLRASTDQLHAAQDRLAGAQLNEQGAALAVEQAQRAYTQAVAAYGPKSLEARQAAYNLAAATDAHTRSAKDVATALEAQKTAEKDVAKNTELEKHLQSLKANTDNVTGAINESVKKLNEFNKIPIGATPAGQKIDLSPLLKKKAKGGPVVAGTQYLTGEEGPELFIPHQSGTIIPAALTKKLMNTATNVGNNITKLGDTIFHIGEIHNEQDENYVLRRIDTNNRLESMGLSPTV